jgi:type I restriction enzyme M protein
LTIEEFEREKKWWGGAERKGRKTNEYAWKVSAKEFAERNYNLDCKNPHEKTIVRGDPEELWKEYEVIAQNLKAVQDELKQELLKALERKT